MRILHGEGFDKEDLLRFRPVVYSNIVKGMKVSVFSYVVISLRSDYFSGKKILQREKELCTIFIHAHFMWGLRLGLGLS